MKVAIDKSFQRDAKRLPIDVQKKLREIIQQLNSVATLNEVGASKLEGSKNAFRIRFGNYRIGIYMVGDLIVLSRVLDRKEIYRYFPKR